MVREERHQRRDHAQRLHERIPQRLERGALAVPEAAARAADVPVGEVVDVRVVCVDDIDRHVRLVRGFRLAYDIQVLSLRVVERGVLKIRVGLVPVALFKIALDVNVFEDAAMTTEDNAAQEFKIVKAQILYLRQLDLALGKIELLPLA